MEQALRDWGFRLFQARVVTKDLSKSVTLKCCDTEKKKKPNRILLDYSLNFVAQNFVSRQGRGIPREKEPEMAIVTWQIWPWNRE